MPSADDNRLQKLAVLVSQLRPDAASALLAELPPAIATLIRELAEEANAVDGNTRDAILREFHEHCERENEDHSGTSKWELFAAEDVASVLQYERPSVVAAFLVQVSETRAAEVITSLPKDLGQQALKQIPRQPPTDLIQTMFLDKLQQRIAAVAAQQASDRQIQSISRLADDNPAAIGPHADAAQSLSLAQEPPIVATPSAAIPEIADHSSICETPDDGPAFGLEPPLVNALSLRPTEDFESIVDIPASVLESALGDLPAETVLIALAGATPSFADRLQTLIHPDDWQALHSGICQIGAIRLDDIEHAQAMVLKAVCCRLTPANQNDEELGPLHTQPLRRAS